MQSMMPFNLAFQVFWFANLIFIFCFLAHTSLNLNTHRSPTEVFMSVVFLQFSFARASLRNHIDTGYLEPKH